MKQYISKELEAYINGLGVSPELTIYLKLVLMIVGLMILSTLLYFIGQFLVNRVINRVSASTKTNWDDIMVERKVFRNLPHLLPALALIIFTDLIFIDFPELTPYIRKITDAFIVILIISVFYSFMNAVRDILRDSVAFRDKPINSYVQLTKIIAGMIGGVMVLSILLGTSPLAVFTAMGALTAIIILIFKDTILGFVASIQLASNDMVRVGDWVTVESFGADGDVIDISLNTIKIRNFDKTISTVPTYAFVTHSFKNWRGMSESDGRRIKKSVFIKLGSIRFLEQSEIEDLKRIDILKPYLERKEKELTDFNASSNFDKTVPVNGRRLTNFGTFRAYIKAYLDNHSQINHDMTCMVRQLGPTPNGVPLELYTFSADKNWVNYEGIMADIFDHIFASGKYFHLEFFENPSGTDFNRVLSN